jgi:2-polyprenyl-6-methoxyphenol hydroxylase-like FAD-dependent oxidoreductase
MRVLIVGAGIGGLTLGIALERAGHAVKIVEKRAHFKEEGAGVVLGPNVMTALRLLDLTDDIKAVGRELTGMNISDARGKVLGHSTYRVAKLLPEPGVAVHRSRLHEVLRGHFKGELGLGTTVTRVVMGDAPAVAADGQTVACDLLVGADGIRSPVRQTMFPDFTTRYSGVTCFRFVIDSRWTDEAFEMWGPGKRVGVVPIGQGKTYAFLAIKAPPHAPPPFSTLEEFCRCWSDFGSPGAEAIAAVHDLRTLLHDDLEDGLAPRFFGPGVVLLGDAAHPVTPNMGQGAGLAIEDACCLATLLDGTRPLANVLAAYEALRRPRATWIRDRSYSLGRLAQMTSPVGRWFRDLAVRWTPASVNDRMLRRILTDIPGVPLEKATPAVERDTSIRASSTP